MGLRNERDKQDVRIRGTDMKKELWDWRIRKNRKDREYKFTGKSQSCFLRKQLGRYISLCVSSTARQYESWRPDRGKELVSW